MERMSRVVSAGRSPSFARMHASFILVLAISLACVIALPGLA